MKTTKIYLVIISSIVLLASCSYLQPPPIAARLAPLEEGETRLTGIEMPEFVREDLVYDVILDINSEETPQINKVCFRWLSEQISSDAPSLNCYAANGDFGTGNACYASTSVTTPSSNSFCVDGSAVKTNVPGRLIVKIQPVNLQAGYNRLEARLEYVHDGQVKVTNAVKTTISVDK